MILPLHFYLKNLHLYYSPYCRFDPVGSTWIYIRLSRLILKDLNHGCRNCPCARKLDRLFSRGLWISRFTVNFDELLAGI